MPSMPELIFIVLVLWAIVGNILIFNKKANIAVKVLTLLAMQGIFFALTIVLLLFIGYSGIFSKSLLTVFIIAVSLFITLVDITLCVSYFGLLKKCKPLCFSLLIGLLICFFVTVGVTGYAWYPKSLPTVGESSNVVGRYAPYTEESLVARLDAPSTMTLTENLPILDGATALYPIYAAFARAVYTEEASYDLYDSKSVHWSSTTGAYEAIVRGDADIIFVAGPSEHQKQFAEENGVTLLYTPIGKEAFVFFVNSKNPLTNIRTDDVRAIYTGEIKQWSALGVSGLGDIRAFQRQDGSGSQSALLRFMGDATLMDPPKEDVVTFMSGIIKKTADYRNFKNAIGYSFRFYSTELIREEQIRLLSLDGVAPTEENIENGSYPVTSHFYAVTRSDADENTKAMLAWILSEQGQELIRKTGYTPLNP